MESTMCHDCGSREAAIHIMHSPSHGRHNEDLCKDCAEARGFDFAPHYDLDEMEKAGSLDVSPLGRMTLYVSKEDAVTILDKPVVGTRDKSL